VNRLKIETYSPTVASTQLVSPPVTTRLVSNRLRLADPRPSGPWVV
jgi:hypothetical protein